MKSEKMGNLSRRQNKKTRFKAIWWTFSILVIVFITQFQIVNGAEFDNVKSYDEKTKTITIENLFGIGKTIATVQLKTPEINKVIRGKDRLVAVFEINNQREYLNVFNKLDFYNLRNEGNKFSREFSYKYKDYIEIPDTELQCKERELNNESGVYYEKYDCKSVVVGTKQKEEWKDLNVKTELPKGIITIGIYTDVLPNDYVEWVPTLFGVEIDEWAVFQESLKVDIFSHWNFNEGSGTIATDGRHHNDLTLVGDNWDTSGVLGSGYVFNGSRENDVNGLFNPFGNDSYSINLWLNISETDVAGSRRIIGNPSSGASMGFEIKGSEDSQPFFRDDSSIFTSDATGNLVEGNNWTMVTFTSNSTTGSFYLNGSLWWNASYTDTVTYVDTFINISHFSGAGEGTNNITFDEISAWTRVLTPSEISDLYNNGEGLEHRNLAPVLNAPNNNITRINKTITFNCSLGVPQPIEVVNVSLFIDGEFNSTQQGTGTNFTEFFGSINFSTAGNHSWYCRGEDDSAGQENSETRIFNLTNLKFVDFGFLDDTMEGSSDTFSTNISIDPNFQPAQTKFIHNNTEFNPFITNLGGGNYTLTTTIGIPIVTMDINKSFLWKINLTNGIQYTSNTTNQTIRNINIDTCASYSVLLLNFSSKDEGNKTILLGDKQNLSVEIDLEIVSLIDSKRVIQKFTQNYSENNNSQICLERDLQNSTYRMDVQVRYDGDPFVSEYYHIQNFSLKNSSLPQNIDLFQLNENDAQKFSIIFKDENYLPIGDALIQIQRKYVSDGIYRTVEIPKTDSDGQSTGQFDLDGVVYTIVVVKNGEVLATFDNINPICQDQIIDKCILYLNARSSQVPFTDWTRKGDITYTISFDKTTRKVTVTFTTTDGSSKLILLNTTKFDRWGNQSVCYDSLTSSSGTLTCTVPESYGNITIVSRLYSVGELITTQTFQIIEDISDRFGEEGILMLFILLITIPFMFISHPIGVVIGALGGLIMGGVLLLYDGGSWFSVTSVFTWALISGIILIWRIAKR